MDLPKVNENGQMARFMADVIVATMGWHHFASAVIAMVCCGPYWLMCCSSQSGRWVETVNHKSHLVASSFLCPCDYLLCSYSTRATSTNRYWGLSNYRCSKNKQRCFATVTMSLPAPIIFIFLKPPSPRYKYWLRLIDFQGEREN